MRAWKSMLSKSIFFRPALISAHVSFFIGGIFSRIIA